eukprot:6924-Heterococcus_DN1.PRE.5
MEVVTSVSNARPARLYSTVFTTLQCCLALQRLKVLTRYMASASRQQPAACRQTATDCYLHVVSQVLYGTLVVVLRFAAVGAGIAAASTDTATAAATAGAVGRAGVAFASASSDLAACETLQPAALHCVPSAGSRLLECGLFTAANSSSSSSSSSNGDFNFTAAAELTRPAKASLLLAAAERQEIRQAKRRAKVLNVLRNDGQDFSDRQVRHSFSSNVFAAMCKDMLINCEQDASRYTQCDRTSTSLTTVDDI